MQRLGHSILVCNHVITLSILTGHIEGVIAMNVGHLSVNTDADAVAVIVIVHRPVAIAGGLLALESRIHGCERLHMRLTVLQVIVRII